MTLHPDGREFYTWRVASDVDPVPAIELSIDGGTTWHATEAVSAGCRALLAGPDADAAEGAIVLPRGTSTFIARAVDNPEVIIRGAGEVEVSAGSS